MRLRSITLLALGLVLGACGDGQHLDGFDGEDETPAPDRGDLGGGASADPPPDDPGDDRPPPDPIPGVEGGALTVDKTWSEGLRIDVDGLRWVGEGEIEMRLATTDATSGAAVGGLDARHFTFAEDGVTLGTEVLFEVRREQNVRVVLVLDLSRSMQEAEAVEPLKSAARTLLQSLPRGARVRLVRFATTFEQVGDFSADSAEVLRAVDDLYPANDRSGRFTNLWGALRFAGSLFDSGGAVEGEGRVVVVFTDGRDNVAEADFLQARSALAEAGALVYAVGLGDDVDAAALSTLAGPSHFTRTADPAALSPIFADIANRIGELLRVRYTTPKHSGEHTVSVMIDDGSRSGGFDLKLDLQ